MIDISVRFQITRNGRKSMIKIRTGSILSKAVLACALAGAASAVLADTEHECSDRPGTISIEGYSTVKASPDVAFIRVAATVQSESAETARQSVENSISRFVDGLGKEPALKGTISTKDGSIRAESISVTPDYAYDTKTNERRVSGYSASRTVTVKVKNFENISKVLDIAVSSGINNIHNISYELENPAPVMEKARLQAVADAAAKASQISKAFGVNLGTIASISYNTPISGSNETYIQPRMMSKGLMSNSIADSSVYSPDKLVFTDNVSVVYNLEQTKKN